MAEHADPVSPRAVPAGPAAARPVSADDVAVTLAVRADLGPEHEPAVIAEFLERVGAAIDERVNQRVDERMAAASGAQPAERRGPPLAFFSLIFGIPITAIAGSQGLSALLVAWGGIAAVNLADALRR